MSLRTWAVVHKETGVTFGMFAERTLANDYIAKVFGPEKDAVFIMQTCEPLINVEFDGIDHSDAHDYCDAYISYAEKEDGTPLTYEELDSIPSDVTYDYLMRYLY